MENAFRRFGVFTVATVFLLIVVGGVVRSTGSGMGCPDWPKCFGQYVPPTAEAQLPANYREVYKENRRAKNEKFAKLVARLGQPELAHRLANDPSIYHDEPFNAVKTWIEYLNRLLGALTGLFILLTFGFSLSFWRRDRAVVWLSLLALVLVLLEAGLGAIVVYTNLLPATITLHMAGALAVVAVLIYAVARSHQRQLALPAGLVGLPVTNGLLLLNLGLFLLQVGLGTQVREAIDEIADHLGPEARAAWIGELGWPFYVHRTYSLVVFGLNAWLAYRLRASHPSADGWASSPVRRLTMALLALLAAEIATGAALAYLGMPAALQPLHLGLAAGIFGVQFGLLLVLNPRWVFSRAAIS
ncbi:MAG: COX15/CtaA family protein [Bernardetiaceae bacterium]|jgi:cytochrome c oxidase assembly protein subunit 15|nr:COX15/CtaA family protein [Bernardetiaceae bacterium]